MNLIKYLFRFIAKIIFFLTKRVGFPGITKKNTMRRYPNFVLRNRSPLILRFLRKRNEVIAVYTIVFFLLCTHVFDHTRPAMICIDGTHALFGKFNFTLVPIVSKGRED